MEAKGSDTANTAKTKELTDNINARLKSNADYINSVTFSKVEIDFYSYKNIVILTNANLAGVAPISSGGAPTTPTKFDFSLALSFNDVVKMLDGMSLTVKDNLKNQNATIKYTGDNFTPSILSGNIDVSSSGVSVGTLKYSYSISPTATTNNGIINVVVQGNKLNFVSTLANKDKSVYFDIVPAKDTVAVTQDFKASFSIGNFTDKITMPKEDFQLFDTTSADLMNNEKSVMTDLFKKYTDFVSSVNK